MNKIKKKKEKKYLNELIKNLPDELIRKIRFMSYKPQKNELLNDIEMFCRTNKLLRQLYFMRIIVRERLKKPEDLNWLINDIFAFLNEEVALMHGYVDSFYDFFMKKKNLNTKKQVDKFIDKLDKGNVSTEINIFIANMTLNQRFKLTAYCLKL